MPLCSSFFFFFFNDTATTEIYTLSLHDALPIYGGVDGRELGLDGQRLEVERAVPAVQCDGAREQVRLERSEEHTSELQSRSDLVCRLLLEKKKKKYIKDRDGMSNQANHTVSMNV